MDGKREVSVAIAPLKGESFALASTPYFGEWEATTQHPDTKTLKSDLEKDDIQQALETGQGSQVNLETRQRDCYIDMREKIAAALSDEDLDQVKADLSQ